MSDGITRVCNVHGFELRTIGSVLVCPTGHDCPLDWTVKTLPYSDPRDRRCPIHGKPLIGSGDVLECDQYGHQVSTRISDRPKPITQFAPPPAPGDRSQIAQPPQERKPEMPVETVLKEHGTAGRYWQGCRCQPCRAAVNEHVRNLKNAKLAREGKPVPQRRTIVPRKPLTVKVKPRVGAMKELQQELRGRERVKVGPIRVDPYPGVRRSTPGEQLEGEVLRLREQLADAERAYLAHVQVLLPGVVIAPRP